MCIVRITRVLIAGRRVPGAVVGVEGQGREKKNRKKPRNTREIKFLSRALRFDGDPGVIYRTRIRVRRPRRLALPPPRPLSSPPPPQKSIRGRVPEPMMNRSAARNATGSGPRQERLVRTTAPENNYAVRELTSRVFTRDATFFPGKTRLSSRARPVL